ncbi:MAG TPA: hypothetical protein P5279_12520 [Anaerohalosphaeraceae bacterium]|jgi:hypothetical protein|nr:hypothetical protein [Anaerohalosphaeraceae bacterium]HRT51314.1 hypothetical protein [Anaerohalosphaeraceae bacterium]HRT88412.1 hypothetical protein [Anaerohalosphaeraceae bacterium]
MAGYLQKVNPGDRLRIAARTYNAFVDAAKAQQMQSLGSQSGPRNDAPVVMLVQVKNVSGSDCPHFGVLGISGVVFDPVAAPDAFKDSVVFSGTTPSALSHAGGRFVICAEPIANGSIGAAWAGGICQVQIEVSNADHAYADVSNGLMTKLASVESGPCTILWKQSGTGTKWAIVRFGGGGGGTGGAAGGDRIAYVKTLPTSGNIIRCYLDAYLSGPEIDVYCRVWASDGSTGNFLGWFTPNVQEGDYLWVQQMTVDEITYWVSRTEFFLTELREC